MNEDLIQYLQVTLEPRRIAVLAELIVGNTQFMEIVKRTKLKPSEVQSAISKFISIGIVEYKNDEYVYVPECVKLLQSQLPKPQKEAMYDSENEEDTERRKVLHNYFRADNSLVRFPLGDKKKKFVLDKIIEEFEKNKEYTEKEVNEILSGYNSDYATLRRAFIDFAYMTRNKGVYKVV